MIKTSYRINNIGAKGIYVVKTFEWFSHNNIWNFNINIIDGVR